jgi:hypothetical protein
MLFIQDTHLLDNTKVDHSHVCRHGSYSWSFFFILTYSSVLVVIFSMLPLDYKGSRSSSGECNSKGIWSVDRAMVEPDRPLLILPNSTASSDAGNLLTLMCSAFCLLT